MPEKAHRGSKTGPIIYAKNCTIKDKEEYFYCCTFGCSAIMTLVNVSDPERAFFRTLPSSPDHISSECVKNGIIFDETKYDERKFEKDSFFKSILESGVTYMRGSTGTNSSKVGGTQKGITTLATLYAMCKSKEKTDEYNGIVINDLLADSDNYMMYKDGIDKSILVECTFFKKIYNEPSFIMNYPIDYKKHRGHVKLAFEDEKMCWEQFKKLKDSNHKEIIVVAGEWKSVYGNPDYESECVIKTLKQIYYVK